MTITTSDGDVTTGCGEDVTGFNRDLTTGCGDLGTVSGCGDISCSSEMFNI